MTGWDYGLGLQNLNPVWDYELITLPIFGIGITDWDYAIRNPGLWNYFPLKT